MRHNVRSGAIGLACLLLAAGVSIGAEKRPVTFDDIMAMKSVGSPQISPDGAWVLYTVRQWEDAGRGEREAGRKESRSHVWRVSTADGAARQLTFGERGESSPAWSPDGRYISLLAARGGTPQGEDEGPRSQIWLMRADGGEAWQLTDAREGVSAYEWAPDAARIAYTSRDPLPKEIEEKRRQRDDPRVFEGDFRYTHVWIIEIESKKAIRVTEGTEYTVRGAPSWAADSRRLAFAAAPTPMVRDSRGDVYIATLDPTSIEKITANLGPDGSPAWSPDGRTIAYLSEPTGKPVADGIPIQDVVHAKLMLYDVASRTAKDASSPQFDLSPGGLVWTPDSRRILFGAGSRVYREIFAYDVATGRYAPLTKGQTISLGNLTRDGARAAFTMDSPAAPADVHVAGIDFASPRKLTDVNPQVRDFTLGETEVVTWKSTDGWEIEGVLLKPVGYQAGRRYPLLVVVHGGPTGAFVNNFRMSAGDPGQHWAGQGWAVLYPNPRGSTNYGEKFMRGNIPDWGGGDYRDIMTGVDAVIQRGVADPDRLAVMGWSYGGYMTCWIVSQTTRFKAAMMGAGLSNLWSMYGTNDIPNYLAAFFRGIPSKQTLPLYLERSGISTADRVTTPLLILHGGSDERVPIGQPMEFFRALKDRGKTVELVFYPREGHGLSEHYHQLDRLKRQHEWITKHTLGDAGRKTTSQ